MQHRTNPERSEATRAALLKAARALFVRDGYAQTSTPQIVALAKVTRGALYHHFADKRDLFRAVLIREAEEVLEEIEAATPLGMSPKDALLAGSVAYLEAMSVAGRTRLMLVDGPAVLGAEEVAAVDARYAMCSLLNGLEAVMEDTRDGSISIPALSVILSAAFDRAALAIERGADPQEFRSAILGLIERVVAPLPR